MKCVYIILCLMFLLNCTGIIRVCLTFLSKCSHLHILWLLFIFWDYFRTKKGSIYIKVLSTKSHECQNFKVCYLKTLCGPWIRMNNSNLKMQGWKLKTFLDFSWNAHLLCLLMAKKLIKMCIYSCITKLF